MTPLDDVDREELRSLLAKIGDKPTQRLIIALLYKEGFSVPDIAAKYDAERSDRP